MVSSCLEILNYNGVHHLEHLLPSALAAVKEFPGKCSILVLDNRSTKNDAAWIKQNFPAVELVTAPENAFLFSYNWLAERRSEDVLFFLNNDLKLCPRFIEPMVRHFDRNDVFAVTATSRDWDDRVFTCGPAKLESHHGFYHWDYARERQKLSHTLFCSGGFMAVDRKKFLALEGFNRLFWPAYGEDVDLGFRAWRKGWRCIFEPASVVLHRENGSWSEQGDSRSARLSLRARLLFQWSSLPPAASWSERNAMWALTALRQWRRAGGWWLSVWFATWREWRGKCGAYRALKTSVAELERIQSEMRAPVSAQAA